MAKRQSALLTAKALAAMAAGEWAADPAAKGAGRLQARKLDNGQVTWYYRYTMSNGARDRLPIGTGLSLAEARERAAALSKRYQAGDKDLRAALLAEEQAAAAATAEATAKAVAHRQASLRALMEAYAASLKAAGKVSAQNVSNALELHLFKQWPELVGKPANDVVIDDLVPVLSRLVHAGKKREAGKLRSYLRAAYAAAIRARQDPAAADDLRDLNIVTNPARDLATIDGSGNARDRNLSLAELRLYWGRIVLLSGATGAILRFHLLTGGQRIAQLARLDATNYDADSGEVILLDPKGRRRRPRTHAVPLVPEAASALDTMRGRKLGDFLFTLSEGAAPATYDEFRNRFDQVVAAMATAGELEGGTFTPGDLRRTVETRLAAAGETDETRGQLQSHGLGGVQNRHYNRHQYSEEKRAALETLYRLLTAPIATVTNIRKSGTRG